MATISTTGNDSDVETCMSMLQQKTHLDRNEASWKVNNYIMAAYHKAGVYLSKALQLIIFHEELGEPKEDLGQWITPCYTFCQNLKAPSRLLVDNLNASLLTKLRRAAWPKRTLVSGLTRNPLTMVASAYCYHHEGQEPENQLMDTPLLMSLGLEEGTNATARLLLPQVEYMASVFAEPDNDTLRLRYEDFVKSSESFDQQISTLLDFFFGTGEDLITDAQRLSIKEAAKTEDEKRNPEATYDESRNRSHGSNDKCKALAEAVLPKIEPSLLARYHELQHRLGYPVGST